MNDFSDTVQQAYFIWVMDFLFIIIFGVYYIVELFTLHYDYFFQNLAIFDQTFQTIIIRKYPIFKWT